MDRSGVVGINQQQVYEDAIIQFEDSPYIETFPSQDSMKSSQSARHVKARPIDPTLETLENFLLPKMLYFATSKSKICY